MIICDTCGKKHKPIFEDSNQGDKCATSVSDHYLIGHYGSVSIDMQKWKFVSRPENIKNGNMCDHCVDKLKATGKIRMVEDSPF